MGALWGTPFPLQAWGGCRVGTAKLQAQPLIPEGHLPHCFRLGDSVDS